MARRFRAFVRWLITDPRRCAHGRRSRMIRDGRRAPKSDCSTAPGFTIATNGPSFISVPEHIMAPKCRRFRPGVTGLRGDGPESRPRGAISPTREQQGLPAKRVELLLLRSGRALQPHAYGQVSTDPRKWGNDGWGRPGKNLSRRYTISLPKRQGMLRKILQIGGDDQVGPALYRSGQHMAVTRVGQIDEVGQILVTCHQRTADMSVDQSSLPPETSPASMRDDSTGSSRQRQMNAPIAICQR